MPPKKPPIVVRYVSENAALNASEDLMKRGWNVLTVREYEGAWEVHFEPPRKKYT